MAKNVFEKVSKNKACLFEWLHHGQGVGNVPPDFGGDIEPDAVQLHLHLFWGQEAALQRAGQPQQLAVGRVASEHGAGPGEGHVEFGRPQLSRQLVRRVQLRASRPVVDRVVMLGKKKELSMGNV